LTIPDSLSFAAAIDTSLDSITATEAKEAEFQRGLDALFAADSLAIDTSGWSIDKINAARFDYRLMTGVIRIPLADPQNGRRFVHPAGGAITSQFGMRHSFWHYGIDIKVRKGDTIRCAFDGMVRVIQNDRYGYGKVVVVRHPDGIESLYGHLSKTLVACNQRLTAGVAVGLGGNTGRSTGSHLHFEIRYRGEPFDPNYCIDFQAGALRSDTLALTRESFAYLAQARSTVYHVIGRGETLGHIARRHGTTVRKLCALNKIRPAALLRIGRKLVIRKDTLPEPLLTIPNLPCIPDSASAHGAGLIPQSSSIDASIEKQ
jgi:hypothetical protein